MDGHTIPIPCPDQPAQPTLAALCNSIAQIRMVAESVFSTLARRTEEQQERTQQLLERMAALETQLSQMQGAARVLQASSLFPFPTKDLPGVCTSLFTGRMPTQDGQHEGAREYAYQDFATQKEITAKDTAEIYHLFKQAGRDQAQLLSQGASEGAAQAETSSIASLYPIFAPGRDREGRSREMPGASAQALQRPDALALQQGAGWSIEQIVDGLSEIATTSALAWPGRGSSSPSDSCSLQASVPLPSPFSTQSHDSAAAFLPLQGASASETRQPQPMQQPSSVQTGQDLLDMGHRALQQSIIHRQLSFSGRYSPDDQSSN